MAHNSWRLRLVHSTSTELTSISMYFTRDTLLARYLLLSVRPSVRPSQAGIVSKRLDKSSWLLARRFPATYPALCFKEIWEFSKIAGTSFWNFVPNSGLRQFRQSKSIVLSTKLLVVVDGRVCWRHLYYNRRVVAVYYRSINCNPLTP